MSIGASQTGNLDKAERTKGQGRLWYSGQNHLFFGFTDHGCKIAIPFIDPCEQDLRHLPISSPMAT